MGPASSVNGDPIIGRISGVFMRWHSNSLGLRETVELGMVARVPAALGDLTVEYGISHLKPEDGGCYTSSQMS